MKLGALLLAVSAAGCATLAPPHTAVSGEAAAASASVSQRLESRSFPAVFQAWNPVDMPLLFPQDTVEARLRAAARHSLLWEEPVSQLGFGTPLVLGLQWAGRHAGTADRFTPESLRQARENRAALLRLNPSMVMLLEVRWRDAPGSFLPEDSPWWLRNPDGSRVKGWDNGPEPYYKLNHEHPGFIANVARQARQAVESGVYDGVMLDWSGQLAVVRAVREALGPEPLIVVNIHDSIEDGKRYAPWINGAFMECGPPKLCTWEGMGQALRWFEQHLRAPRVNALEAWGDRRDLATMRAVTTLALTQSDAFVLFADPNPLATPDHLHDWYPFWDKRLGRPLAPGRQQPAGHWQRQFEFGTAVHNPHQNAPVTLRFDSPRTRASNGRIGTVFSLAPGDGDIFSH